MSEILLRRTRDQIPKAVKAGAVAGAVPAALIRIPLQLAAHMRAACIDGIDVSILVLADADFFTMQENDSSVAIRDFRRLFRRNLKEFFCKPFDGLPAFRRRCFPHIGGLLHPRAADFRSF